MTAALGIDADELDDACTRMRSRAAALIAAVAERNPARVRAVLGEVRTVPVPDGVHPTDVLAITLADMAPTEADLAVITVLRHADGPADAAALLAALGLAGHGQAASTEDREAS